MSDLETIPSISDALLSVHSVESGYGDFQVLYDIEFAVREDEIVLIFGPNGAGKSTCMKTIYGLLPLWSGNIEVNGFDITDIDAEQMFNYGLNYIPQRENVFGNLTVAENMDIGALHVDNPDERMDDMYDLFPILNDRRHQKADTMSGGERQQLAMARVLMMDPDILLIDEPSAGLSPQAREKVFNQIDEIRNRGTAILMVEQQVKAGLSIADRGYVLDRGRTRFEAPSDELADSETIRELYLRG